MNNLAMAQAVQKKVRPRFRGQKNMLPKVPMHFPMNMEREYIGIANAYMTLLYKTVAKYLPKIRKAAYDDSKATTRCDSVDDVISDTFTQMQIAFEEPSRKFALERRLTTLAEQTRRVSVAEWRRVVQSSLGINIMEDYYMGEFFRNLLQQWVTRNVDLISSVPKSTLTEIQNIVTQGWQSGALTRDIAKWLERQAFPFEPGDTPVTKAMLEAYAKNKCKAEFWARDQMAKLNTDLAQQQQKDAGVEEYIWSTSGDERVRGNPAGKWPNTKDNHYKLDGRRFSWESPPEVAPGRNCHPGEDFNCRCVALPIFNLPGLILP